MRLAIRVFKAGTLLHAEDCTIPEDGFEAFVQDLRERHTIGLVDSPDMIEIEFLDEPNIKERFVRFGSDPSAMVPPINVDLR